MHRLIVAAVAAFSTLTLLIATASVARADPPPGGAGEVCVNGVCTVTVTQPGGGGGGHGGNGGGNGSGGGGGGGCTWKGKKYPCSDVRYGYFSNGCYYRAASPPPAPGDPLWTAVGHKPSDNGAIYNVQCLPLNFRGATSAWFAAPPAGPPPPPPAVTLAQRAAAKLAPKTLTAASNGGVSKTTYVNVKTWLWAVGPWAPLQAKAKVGTRAVTLVATPVGTRWVMGDGSAPVRCNGPGKPYDAADPNNPPCSYTYAKSSIGQPQEGPSVNDRFFHVQGSVVYSLHWTCTGNCDENAGDLPDLPHNTTPMPLRVFEVQTVVRH